MGPLLHRVFCIHGRMPLAVPHELSNITFRLPLVLETYSILHHFLKPVPSKFTEEMFSNLLLIPDINVI